jgi:hypothetical protein
MEKAILAYFQVQYWHSLQTLSKAMETSIRLTGVENQVSAC